MLQVFALIAFFGSIVWAGFMVPDYPWRHLDDPAHLTVLGTPLMILAMIGVRAFGIVRRWDSARAERILFAVFLAAMPSVYILSSVLAGAWNHLPVEVAGQVLFAALAVLGLRSSPWFLAVGILGHGVGWDLWHRGQAGSVPTWYADTCLILDVGFSLYAAAQVERWKTKAR